MRSMGRWIVVSLSAVVFVPALVAQATPAGASPRSGFQPPNFEILRQRLAARRGAQVVAQPTPALAAPTQPVTPPTLNQQPSTPPQVSYQNGALSITAENSTLGDILREVQKSTGATIEVPPNATERVVTRLGPAPPREVLASLLNGSSFNYVMVGSAADPNSLTTVMLSPRVGGAAPQPMQTAEVYQQQPPPVRTGFVPPPVPTPAVSSGDEKDEEDTDEDNSDEDQNGSGGPAVMPPPPQQQTPDGTQPPNAGPKTPQQIMEMLRQNRQQQKQDNQDQQDPPEQ